MLHPKPRPNAGWWGGLGRGGGDGARCRVELQVAWAHVLYHTWESGRNKRADPSGFPDELSDFVLVVGILC